jgi:hypothetical protein
MKDYLLIFLFFVLVLCGSHKAQAQEAYSLRSESGDLITLVFQYVRGRQAVLCYVNNRFHCNLGMNGRNNSYFFVTDCDYRQWALSPNGQTLSATFIENNQLTNHTVYYTRSR